MDEIESDTEDWSGVKVVLTSTFISSAAFCFVFEFARRLDLVKEVFDMRRKVRPNHTPPPLIQQRYFEWWFLSTEPGYTEYAKMQNERILQERKSSDIQVSQRSIVTELNESALRSSKSVTTASTSNNNNNTISSPKSTKSTTSPRFGSPTADIPDIDMQEGIVQYNGRYVTSDVAEFAISNNLTDEQLEEYLNQMRPKDKMKEKKSSSTNSKKLERSKSSSNVVSSFVEKWNLNTTRSKHLKGTKTINRRPLNIVDAELFRCVGLDVFLMLKFIQLGFDVTFYPFLLACITLIPLYYNNDPTLSEDLEVSDIFRISGYFRFTINRLEPGSAKLWIPWIYSVFVYCMVIRRLWLAWETFMELRFDFLANGTSILVERSATGMGKNEKINKNNGSNDAFGVEMTSDVDLHKQQFRNSCIVEYIPKSHRSDKDLYDFFDAIFPGQVKRAEILINAAELTNLICERQKCIEAYEDIYAKYFHAKSVYQKKITQYNNQDTAVSTLRYFCCFSCGKPPNKPTHPMKIVKKHKFLCLTCGKEEEHKALPYYLSEITRLNDEIEKGHRHIVEERRKVQMMEKDEDSIDAFQQGLNFISGGGWELNSSTGFVEFQNLTAKQSAIQCNISGNSEYMVAESAPDPRDILWENASTESSTIKWKHLHCDFALFVVAIFWASIVSTVVSFSTGALASLFGNENVVVFGLIRGYLPVLVLEGLVVIVNLLVGIAGTKYIKFKLRSDADTHVFVWHMGIRLANFLIIVISFSVWNTSDLSGKNFYEDFLENPTLFVQMLSEGIGNSSQFFLNNIIVLWSSHLFELAQMTRMALYFITHRIITEEAKSQRFMERLKTPVSFIWGREIPPLIFTLSIGLIFCATVPIVTGAAALGFLLAKKVYTHQALFVYDQTYESGGKLMYTLNRMLFIQLYVAITVFSVLLGLKTGGLKFKSGGLHAPLFFIVMMGVTLIFDSRIQSKFARPSLTLALANARIIDDEMRAEEEKNQRHFSSETLRKKAAKVANKARKIVRMKQLEAEQEKQKLIENEIEIINAEYDGEESVAPQDKTKNSDHDMESGDIKNERTISIDETKVEADIGEEEERGSFYLYRQPQLNKYSWETKPRPYR